MENCLRSTEEASPTSLTKQYRYGKQLHAGFATRRVHYVSARYMFATDMPNSFTVLIYLLTISIVCNLYFQLFQRDCGFFFVLVTKEYFIIILKDFLLIYLQYGVAKRNFTNFEKLNRNSNVSCPTKHTDMKTINAHTLIFHSRSSRDCY